MKKEWLLERLEFFESFFSDNPDYGLNMEERDKNLIKLLKKFKSLSKRQQDKLQLLLGQTIERHKEIRKYLIVHKWYTTNYKTSLDIKRR